MTSGTFGFVSLMWVLVGVYCYAGLTHLQIGLRRPRKRLHITFGVLALLAAYIGIASAFMASSRSPVQFQSAAWHSTYAVLGLFILLPWFVRDYIAQTTRWPATLVSGVYLIVLIGNLFLPYSMLLSSPVQLGITTLPWGERIAHAESLPHSWIHAFWFAHAFTIGYFAFAIAHAFHRRSAASAWGLAAGGVPFAIALAVNVLIGIGVLRSNVFVGSIGFMALILAMSVILSESLRRSSKQMQTVLDNVPAIVYLKHRDGRYLFVNRRFEQIYGLNAAHAIGKRDIDIFSAAIAAERMQADAQVLTSGHTTEREENLTVHGNTPARVYGSLRFVLTNSRGQAYAVCGIATDITERKAATDVLRDLSATLERRVTRRTSELAQLNRELEAFAYSVSHDLRAPLTAVNGFAELLLREHGPRLDQTANRYLTRIRDGSIRMAGLIQDLLGLSRVTQQSLERQSTDLMPLIEASIKALRETEPARTVIFIAPNRLPVNGDPKLLGLALNNLLANAWKYTSKIAEPRVEVGAVEQSGETVYFVRDNGAGFNPEYADRLFRPFVRLHSDNEFPGTGIGLATVARIVSRHGGRIWADGKPDEGATFYFTLPLPEEDIGSHTSTDVMKASG